MKKQTKKSNKPKLIKQLATELQSELEQKLPVTVLPDGAMVYKDYLVKQTKQGNWGLYHIVTKSPIDQYYLKTCALMAAKAYARTNIEKFLEVKRLDNRYWASHIDTQIYTNNIKNTKDYDRYLILLNKLEDSKYKETFYKDEISKMFKWTFV
jgi:hypothetical protein